MWWLLFNVFILAMLAIDLGLFQRKAHEVRFREAVAWTGVWVFLALLFGAGIHAFRGPAPGMQFLAGYLVELSLSVDNLFVFLLLFSYFRVPRRYQHKVLFWGILGAILMRSVFILSGIALIRRFEWILYIFGALLLVTAFKLLREREKKVEPERNPVLRIMRKFLPLKEGDESGRLLVRDGGRTYGTSLLVVLVAVETMDVVFAIDSIPAVFAITRDPFIAYTSNMFAILGLRSMFFALSGALQAFHRLNVGLSVILGFVGLKMLLSRFVEVPIGASLGFIVAVLAASIAASLLWPPKNSD
ncbi:MAG: TerC family protein [Pseudomonadota bacterium]